MKTTFNLNRPYVRNSGVGFAPLYLPGERYSFYLNLTDRPSSYASRLVFNLIDSHTNDVIKFFAPVSVLKVTSGTSGYHYYLKNFVMPKIADGQYFFNLTNPYTNMEVARSNIIQVSSKCLTNTSYIEYRHNDKLYNIRYDLLPSDFYMKFRLPINQIDAPEIKSEKEQYRASSNERDLHVSKAFRDIIQKYEMYWSNAEDFEALSAMLLHSDVRINGSRLILLDQVKVEQPSPFSEQYKGTFTCIVKQDIIENYMPDIMIRAPYICDTFFRGK